MSGHRITVTVRKWPDRQNLMLVYRDPVTGKVKGKSAGTSNQRLAHRAAIELEDRLNNVNSPLDGGLPWEEFLDLFIAGHCSGLKDTSAHKQIVVLESFTRQVQPQNLRSITNAVLTRYVVWLRSQGRAEATIASYLGTLRVAFNWAVAQGYLSAAPKLPKVTRSKTGRVARGRGLTLAEFVRMLRAVPAVVGAESAAGWVHLLKGLWLSGLRIEEAVRLTWDDRRQLCVDWSGQYPMLWIPAELEKGHRDRLMPITPDFARLLDRTPAAERTGFVFGMQSTRGVRPSGDVLTRKIAAIGQQAGIVVEPRTGKHASAHDLRRTFGQRWASRVLSQTLREMMRHESLSTTMAYYVGVNASATAETLWKQARKRT